jgi:polar amino acid transport system substrate-binding protein
MGYPGDLFGNLFAIHTDELYYAFNRETADGLIDRFQSQLDKVKTDKSIDGSSEYEKIFNRYQLIRYATDGLTTEQVIALVERTVADLEADAPGTIARMNQGLAPYKDPVNPALYSFMYDMNVVMVAHADNPSLVGNSFAGKPDAAGKKFRDDIIKGARENGSGWVDYVYTKPDQSGLYHKTTYYKRVTGSNAIEFVVCSGKFR